MFKPRISQLACTLLFVLNASAFGSDLERINILVINSYHTGYNWSDGVIKGLSGLMGAQKPEAQCSYEYLDWQRFPSPDREQPMLDALHQKYVGANRISYIVTLDDPALNFALRHRDQLGGEAVPIVFGGINRLDPTLRERHRNLTGHAEVLNIAENIELMLTLQPHLKKVYALHDQTQSALLNRDILESVKPRFSSRVEFEYLTNWSLESLLGQIENLQPDSAILSMGVGVDREGRAFGGNVALQRQIKQRAKAPIYRLGVPISAKSGDLGLESAEWGSIGGYMTSGVDHGQDVARTLIRVIEGTPADQIPFIYNAVNALLLDYRELQRFGIPMERVPKNAQIFFAPNHAFTFSRQQVYGGIALLLVVVSAATYLFFNNLARRRAEAALRRFAAAIEQGTEIIIFLEPNGRISYVNPAFVRLTGVPAAEAIGRPHDFCLTDAGPRPAFAQIVAECQRAGVWTGRIEYLNSRHERLHQEVMLTPIRSPGGEVVGYVQVGRDTTREDKLEEQVRLSQKMEAIGLLAGGVAHDFNNLLQVIMGCTQDALTTELSPQERKESLQLTLDASQRAAALTRQLLLFGRRQQLQASDIDLGELTEDLLKFIKRLIGEHITIERIISPKLGNIRGDKGQIEQVLMNLCLNARDAMPAGGILKVELNNLSFDEAFCITHPWARPGDFVQLIVSDTGVGMDKATADRIFDPFFTTKTKDKGTGLGLSVVYGIVQSHRGLIQVYSEPGLGTSMKTYWPVVPRQIAADPVARQPVSDGRSAGSVLLAEDEESVRGFAAKVLARAGYRVIEARDGQEAVELFKRHQAEIHVVVLDAVMPRLSGPEAKRLIRQMRSDVPVLFCSGYSMEALQEDNARACDLGLLAKPYGSDALLHRIKAALP